MKYKTVRCVLRQQDRYFLVVHNSRLFTGNRPRWGLPGGRIEWGEDFEEALARELWEELSIDPKDFAEIGDYRYKGFRHKIFGADFDEPILRFDRSEIRKIGWHSYDEIMAYEAAGQLHTGFELDAIRDFAAIA